MESLGLLKSRLLARDNAVLTRHVKKDATVPVPSLAPSLCKLTRSNDSTCFTLFTVNFELPTSSLFLDTYKSPLEGVTPSDWVVPPQAEDHDGSWALIQPWLPKVREAHHHSWPNQLCEFPHGRTCQRQGRITPLFETLENIFTYPHPRANRRQAASLVHKYHRKISPADSTTCLRSKFLLIHSNPKLIK